MNVESASPTVTPIVLPRGEHTISRRDISPEALKVLYRLHNSGQVAYLVGGSVRDLLLGRKPRDFDIGTDAHPGRLRRLFRNCRIIGRRFKLGQVYFPGGRIVEVATFRRHAGAASVEGDAGRAEFNTFGTPAEDARRRDITINGLFYDIATFSVIDHVGGLRDLKRRLIRTIKSPAESFAEDPIRIVRVMRHAARTGFEIDQETWDEVMARHRAVMQCSMDRLREELFKDLVSGKMEALLELFHASGFLYSLFPEFEIKGHGRVAERLAFLHRLIEAGSVIDRQIRATAGEPPRPALLLTILLMPYFSMNAWKHPPAKGLTMGAFLRERFEQLLAPALLRLRVPRDTQAAMVHAIIMCEKIRQAVDAKGAIPRAFTEAREYESGLAVYRADMRTRGQPGEEIDRVPVESEEEPEHPPARRRRRRRPRRRSPNGPGAEGRLPRPREAGPRA